MFGLPKRQKLCNEKKIKELFSKGNTFVVNPIRIVWQEKRNTEAVVLKSIIVVPKKNHKLAVERNIIRRRMKEAYRLNKSEVESFLLNKNKQINIAIIYQNPKILPYKVIENKIKLTLSRLKKEI